MVFKDGSGGLGGREQGRGLVRPGGAFSVLRSCFLFSEGRGGGKSVDALLQLCVKCVFNHTHNSPPYFPLLLASCFVFLPSPCYTEGLLPRESQTDLNV